MLKQLSAQDAQFLYTQTANNLTHIMGVYIYDPSTAPGGFVRFKDIIRHVESRVDTSPCSSAVSTACRSTWTIPIGSRTSISTSRRI